MVLPEGNGSPVTGCRRIGIGVHGNKGGPQTANQTGFEKDHLATAYFSGFP